MTYDWSWAAFLDVSPDGVHSYLQAILIGTLWTLLLSMSAFAASLLAGAVLGIMRTVPSARWNFCGTLYVEVFRNIPLLVQMFLWYFVLPEVVPGPLGMAIKRMPQPWGSFVPALLCLACYGSARICEQVRAGIQSLPRGQFEAATALALTRGQLYRRVILPQTFRIIIPPLTSEFVGMVKYSSVALTIGLLELTGEARSMQEYSFHIFEAFGAATAIYLMINSVIVHAMAALERRSHLPGLMADAASTP